MVSRRVVFTESRKARSAACAGAAWSSLARVHAGALPVRRSRAVTPLHARAGFSLVETVVAAVLLSVAVLSVAAGGAAALRALASAERVQGAVIAGRAVLDSLAHRPVAGAGTVDRPPFRVGWYAADTAGLVRIVVVVRTVAGSDSVLALSVLAAPPPRLR